MIFLNIFKFLNSIQRTHQKCGLYDIKDQIICKGNFDWIYDKSEQILTNIKTNQKYTTNRTDNVAKHKTIDKDFANNS